MIKSSALCGSATTIAVTPCRPRATRRWAQLGVSASRDKACSVLVWHMSCLVWLSSACWIEKNHPQRKLYKHTVLLLCEDTVHVSRLAQQATESPSSIQTGAGRGCCSSGLGSCWLCSWGTVPGCLTCRLLCTLCGM